MRAAFVALHEGLDGEVRVRVRVGIRVRGWMERSGLGEG